MASREYCVVKGCCLSLHNRPIYQHVIIIVTAVVDKPAPWSQKEVSVCSSYCIVLYIQHSLFRTSDRTSVLVQRSSYCTLNPCVAVSISNKPWPNFQRWDNHILEALLAFTKQRIQRREIPQNGKERALLDSVSPSSKLILYKRST